MLFLFDATLFGLFPTVVADLYKNLMWLLKNSVVGLELDFTVSYMYGSHSITMDLKPNGASIPVTDSNKNEYLQLRLRHRMLDSIKPQLEQFLRGFYEVIPPDLLSVFDYQELDLLICGVPDIDMIDWMQNTEYLGEYAMQGKNHRVVKWFWQTVEDYSIEERVRLLQFTTGCCRLPPQGFKYLQSNNGNYRRFNIQSIFKSVWLCVVYRPLCLTLMFILVCVRIQYTLGHTLVSTSWICHYTAPKQNLRLI